MIHRGQIVENIVRKSGYHFTTIAAKLRISRNTLYNRFNNANLSYSCIADIGNIIHYDFSIDIPELKKEIGGGTENPVSGIQPSSNYSKLLRIENKYARLLEKYNKLIAMLVHVANHNELHELKDEVLTLIEKEKEEPKQPTEESKQIKPVNLVTDNPEAVDNIP